MDKSHFKPRDVLRQNLKALLQSDHGPNSQSELFRKSGVAQATIGRILSAKGENARIETIDRLAAAFGLQGWQLMVPGMDPANPPVLVPISKAERALYESLKNAMREAASQK